MKVEAMFDYLAREGINDELDEMGRNLLDAFLNHVVSVLILHAFHHVTLIKELIKSSKT